MRTTAISNNLILILTTRGPMPSQFKFLPTNLNVQAGRNSVFCSKRYNLRHLSNLFMEKYVLDPQLTFILR